MCMEVQISAAGGSSGLGYLTLQNDFTDDWSQFPEWMSLQCLSLDHRTLPICWMGWRLPHGLLWKLQRSRALWHCPLLCRWKAVSACALFRMAKWALLLNFGPVRGRRSNMLVKNLWPVCVVHLLQGRRGMRDRRGGESLRRTRAQCKLNSASLLLWRLFFLKRALTCRNQPKNIFKG